MKRRRNMLTLLGVLAVLCIAILVVTGVQKHMDTIATTDEEIVAVDPAALTRVSWSRDGASLAFASSDGVWTSTDDADFPVDQEKMADFLAHFESVRASFIIDDVEDYAQYGLASPECTITLTAEDGDTVIQLGGYSTMDSKRYLTLGQGTVYLIDDDLLDYVPADRDDFLRQDSVPAYDTIDAITYAGGNTLSIAYLPEEKLTYTDEYDYYLQEGDSCKALSTAKVEGLVTTLAGLDYGDYVTYTASRADLADYGLDSPAAAVTVTTTLDGEQTAFTLYLGQDGEENGYARVDGSEIIFRVEQETMEELLAVGYDTLRPSELLALDWDKVQGLTVTIDDAAYEITHTAGADTIGETEVELDDVMDAVDALTASEFSDEAPAKKQEIALTIRYDDEDYPLLELALYQYDGENCLAQVDGATVGLVARSDVVTLTEAVNAIILGLA